MKIVWLVILLIAIALGGNYLIENLQMLNLPTLMSTVPPTPRPTIKSNPQLTPIECSGIALPAAAEGPYYKAGSPENNKIDTGINGGTKLKLQGYVLDTNCKPIPNAWIDFWQADSNGEYDNIGFKLRGHQYTDQNGKYVLETVIPGEYPGRTPHIHAKVKARENSYELTTQIFIPGIEKNLNDGIFNKALLMDIKDTPSAKDGTFNFIINTDL